MTTARSGPSLDDNQNSLDIYSVLLSSEQDPPISGGVLKQDRPSTSWKLTGSFQRLLGRWIKPNSWLADSHVRGATYNALPTDQGQSRLAHSRDGHTWIGGCKAIILSSWANALLVFVPAGIATGLCKVPPIVVFACNAIAIVPLSSLLAFATECIASDLGDTVGALMNISFGNLIEVIMFVTALAHDEIYVVQGALVGSILVNLLLILGTAIIAGEFQPLEMVYDMNNAQALACLLSLSVFSILIPAAFQFTFEDDKARQKAVLTLSRASAITLLVVYAIYLRFLLRPRVRHTVINDGEMMSGRASSFEFSDTRSISRLSRTIRFADEHSSDHESVKPDSASNQGLEMETMSEQDDLEDSASSDEASDSADVGQRQPLKPVRSHHRPPAYPRSPSYSRSRSSSLNDRRRLRHSDIAERYGGSVSDLSDSHLLPRTVRPPIASGLNDRDYSSDREQRPPIGRIAALVLLVVSSLLVAVCAELLVQTIAAITADSILSESFIGLIVLPIAGNAAEHITAVTVAAKGKVDLAIGVSFGSSIQIALFVNPLMVILGWVMKKDMSLYFGLFETATLIGVALLVNFLIWNGRTNYLEGTLLCACYVMIGVGAFLIP